RRPCLGAAVAMSAAALASSAQGQAPPLVATPACGDAGSATPSRTAGPFFKPSSPRRASLLERGLAGTRLVVTGRVVWVDCRLVAGALLDFWQADARGAYDNAGYRLRGHPFAGRARPPPPGAIVPGPFPARTPHL